MDSLANRIVASSSFPDPKARRPVDTTPTSKMPRTSNHLVKQSKFIKDFIAANPGNWLVDESVLPGINDYRPDLLLVEDSHVFHLEIDENGHCDRDHMYELLRENQVDRHYAGKTHFLLRVNPDAFIAHNGKRVESVWEKLDDGSVVADEDRHAHRVAVATTIFRRWRESPPSPDTFVRTHIFFDGYNPTNYTPHQEKPVDPYPAWKMEFEKTTFWHTRLEAVLQLDGDKFRVRTLASLPSLYKQSADYNFVKRWTRDPDARKCHKVDRMNPSQAVDGVFNLYQDHPCKGMLDLPPSEIDAVVRPVLAKWETLGIKDEMTNAMTEYVRYPRHVYLDFCVLGNKPDYDRHMVAPGGTHRSPVSTYGITKLDRKHKIIRLSCDTLGIIITVNRVCSTNITPGSRVSGYDLPDKIIWLKGELDFDEWYRSVETPVFYQFIAKLTGN